MEKSAFVSSYFKNLPFPRIGGSYFLRVVDAMTSHAGLEWSTGASLSATTNGSPHRFTLSIEGTNRLEFLLSFSADRVPGALPGVDTALRSTARHWNHFWLTGGAIDRSASKDSRWFELERRVVLSQYLMGAQSAGGFPCSESGLMEIDPWRGPFHMEMVWWHLAHYALWDRWSMAEKAVGCYQRVTPSARALAEQLGHRGLKWGKSVGPEGRSARWIGNQVQLWHQPHPILFAESEYRSKPTRATLKKWADVVAGAVAHGGLSGPG